MTKLSYLDRLIISSVSLKILNSTNADSMIITVLVLAWLFLPALINPVSKGNKS